MNYMWTNNTTTKEFEIIRILDGDTIDVMFDIPFDFKACKRIRLARVDAPEIRTRDEKERKAAIECKEYVIKQLATAKEVKIVTYQTGKYGRYLADIFIDGRSLNKAMVEDGKAKAYKKGGRVGKGR